MEEAGKIISLALIAAIFCVLLRNYHKPMAMILSLVSCIGIVLVGFRFLEPILSVIDQIRELAKIDDAYFSPLIKIVGISFLTQLAKGVCADANEVALGNAVEVSGTLLAVYCALPLVQAVLKLLEQLIGGLN